MPSDTSFNCINTNVQRSDCIALRQQGGDSSIGRSFSVVTLVSVAVVELSMSGWFCFINNCATVSFSLGLEEIRFKLAKFCGSDKLNIFLGRKFCSTKYHMTHMTSRFSKLFLYILPFRYCAYFQTNGLLYLNIRLIVTRISHAYVNTVCTVSRTQILGMEMKE